MAKTIGELKAALLDAADFAGEVFVTRDEFEVLRSAVAVSRTNLIGLGEDVSALGVSVGELRAAVDLGGQGGPVAGGDDLLDPDPVDPTDLGLISIRPNVNAQAVVDANPAGTGFVFEPGVHVMPTIRPKTGDSYWFRAGAIMRGSKVLDGWQRGDRYWFLDGQTQRAAISGGSFRNRDARAEHPNDLITGAGSAVRHRRHLASLEAIKGTDGWFFDYDAKRICIGFDPASAGEIRGCVAEWAFLGDEGIDDVTIASLDRRTPGRICEYATPNGQGVINGWRAMWGWNRDGAGVERIAGKRWEINALEVDHNHAKAFNLAQGWVALDCLLHHNLEMGYGAQKTGAAKSGGIEVSRCEVAHNNYMRTWSDAWHACGSKLTNTLGAKVHHNWYHHNGAAGLWFDIKNEKGAVHHNLCEDNAGAGIFWEHGHDCEIYQNLSRRNGADPDDGRDVWVGNAQIIVTAATGGKGAAEVHHNVLEIPDPGHDMNAGPDGLIVRDDNRTVTRNINVHHNRIVFGASMGVKLRPRCGIAVENSTPQATLDLLLSTVRWDNNQYFYPGPITDKIFLVPKRLYHLPFGKWRDHAGRGWDLNSVFIENIDTAALLSDEPSGIPEWDAVV